MPKPQPSKKLKANHTFVHVHRQILGDKGKNIWIISKIENQQGIKNLTEIIKTSDGNMVICATQSMVAQANQASNRHCAWWCQGRLPRGITQPSASKQLPRLPLRYTDLWLVTWWPVYLLLIGLYLFIQGHNEDGKGKDILPASSSFSQLNAEKESIIRLVYPNVKVTFRTTWLSFWWLYLY